MKHTEVFKEARRLHKLGFAIHWLHPKSKRPIESGWTTGPRKDWEYLKETYIEGLNVGVRLGAASPINGCYLAVVDIDIKSTDEKHRLEAVKAAKALIGGAKVPIVMSGRGNGSRHFYCLTVKPFKTWNPAVSQTQVKVHMPSKKPSKKEIAELTREEIEKGVRIANAWEVSLYSEGRQVVLPPSIHPDSGETYTWLKHLGSVDDLPVVEFPSGDVGATGDDGATGDAGSSGNSRESDREAIRVNERSEDTTLEFKVEPVDLEWLPISDKVKEGIINGTDVSDRSGYLLPAATALLSAGLTQNEVLTVLTDPDTFLGACAYDHAKTKNRRRAAEWLNKYTLKKVVEERSAERVFTKASEVEPAKTLSPEEIEIQNEELFGKKDWRYYLIRTGPKGDGPPKGIIQNVVLILKNAVDANVVTRNTFAFRDTYGCDTPWGGKKNEVIADDDVSMIRLWISEKFGFEPKRDTVSEALINIACQNSYDPVRDWIDALEPWDGKARLDSWLKKYFDAQGDDEYLGQVFRKWIVAMVLRIYKPGAKFDWMPIFEGAQGVGKSSFGRLLCGDKYFLDWLPNLADKDAALALQGMWVVEMGELSQFRKNEMEVIKGFITRTVDKVRPPHARRWVESARRCVFFGTTNRDKYLRDDTGNRRLKPVIVGDLDFKALKRDRVQLFAEAKWLLDNKKESELTLELVGNAKVFEAEIHAEKMVEDDATVMREQIEIFLKKMAENEDFCPSFNPTKFRVSDLFLGIGPLPKWRSDGRNHQFAAKALKNLGAEKWKSHGQNYWKITDGDRFGLGPIPGDFY